MSALYVMNYLGQASVGAGAVYIGKGIIVGVDVANGRYNGTYREEGGRFKGTVVLSAPPGGATLVTGQPLPAGQSLQINFDWPPSFADGSAQSLSVAGRPVQVTLQKVGDIP